MPKNVLLVGGKGYLGRGISHSLEASGHRVNIWDFPNEIKDLRASDVLSVDLVMNLAVVAEPGISAGLSHHSASWRTNVQDFAQLIDVCQEAGKTLVHFSTREVHAATYRENELTLVGDVLRPKRPMDENVGFKPSSAYGRSKLIAEWLCEAAERCFVVRLGTPYTDETPAAGGGLIATLVRKAVLDGRVDLQGGGRQFRDPLHVKDISDLAVRLSSEIPEERVFNAGGGPQNIISLKEIALLANPDCVVAETAGGDFGFAMDIDPAVQRLGWKPQVEVREAIGRFAAAYYKKHGKV